MWRARAACACLVLLPWSAGAQTADSVYTLPPVHVRARRPVSSESIRLLAGQATTLAVEPFRPDITNTTALLERLPGLSLRSPLAYAAQASPQTTGCVRRWLVCQALESGSRALSGGGLLHASEAALA